MSTCIDGAVPSKDLSAHSLYPTLTLKKDMVDPPLSVPYCMLFCAARSAALWMGSTVRSTVKNAARFAVYDERIISVKNHQIPPTMRVDVA